MSTIAWSFDHDHGASVDDLKPILGGKGANLNNMAVNLGLPVPSGFTIAADQTFKHAGSKSLSKVLRTQVRDLIDGLEDRTGRGFGDPDMPLLVSVRSGAAVSMPGMMETILNLGMNVDVAEALASVDERWAWDSYRRFLTMYGIIVNGVDPEFYASRMSAAKRFFGSDDLDADFLRLLCGRLLAQAPAPVPSDPVEQLEGAILAVFRSWNMPKAVEYRKIEGIADDLGTAVNVQQMVFGNLNERSGTGVAFTRDPNTGVNGIYGDFLAQAQGEDVVDGSHITTPIEQMPAEGFGDAFDELIRISTLLEQHYRDMLDIEFTIEDDTFYVLQARVGKRAPRAAVRMAVDMLADGLIDGWTANERIDAVLDKITSGVVVDTSDMNFVEIGSGIGACPGTVVGEIATTKELAVAAHEAGRPVILVRTETSPDDITGMSAADGILTAVGGVVSHAAVVARGWGKPCVVGCSAIVVTPDGVAMNGELYPNGTMIRIHGDTGVVEVNEAADAVEFKRRPATDDDIEKFYNDPHACKFKMFIPAGTQLPDVYSGVTSKDHYVKKIPDMNDLSVETEHQVQVKWDGEKPEGCHSSSWWIPKSIIWVEGA